jgi:hypothetical protein
MGSSLHLGNSDDPQFQLLLPAFDAPAFLRRDRRVREAYDQLLERCRRQRDEWLGMVRTRLGVLRALAGTWDALRPLLTDAGQLALLRGLHAALQPFIRAPIDPTDSRRALRHALLELHASVERFNRRWERFLAAVDLTGVNRERENYNRYYLLEKECAIRSARLAMHGFFRLEPATLADLTALFPRLAVPELAHY